MGAALFTVGGIGCTGGEDAGPLGNVDALVILQRPKRNDAGDIFQYTSYMPGARLVKLSPPTADGKLTTICCDKAGPEFSKIDISSYDLSFDAKSIVFSGKLADDQTYGLFLVQLSDGSVTQVATDPGRDFVSPIFLPGNKLMFTSNAVVEAGAPQHLDEYERGTTIQLGTVNLDGTHLELGPRNLSHRTQPSLLSDGRVVFTQWDHLGGENSGHLMIVNQDMRVLREGFGKEGTGASNSTLKAREISQGRLIAIATARSRTIQSGALIDIRLGDVVDKDGIVSAPTNQAEAHASYKALTPDVPMDDAPSADTVGRYYDAFPLNAKDKPDLLVSWANGPVESSVLSAAGLTPNFGVYTYDSLHQQRHPILDDPDMWDILARPLATRSAPNVVDSAQDLKLGGQTLIGSLNVYDSSLHTFKPGEIYGVRVMEGFSSEEGFYREFGTTMFEGQANLGIAPVKADGSWAATVPANVPIHVQTVDQFGMSLFSEPVWFSGRAGESRLCGGCHEDRTRTTNVSPGLLDAFATGAVPLMGTTPRAQRLKLAPTSATQIVGVAWPTMVQPILTAKCVECHGNDNKAGIKPYTISDPTGAMAPMTWTFNLTGEDLPATAAVRSGPQYGTYSKSYFSMFGPDPEAIERGGLMISGNYKVYMNPQDAHGSLAISKLNPTKLFPTVDQNVRAFANMPHLVEQGRADLTAQEFYTFILSVDMGGQFYARENNPMVNVQY
jgi:hypothetical protein